MERNHSIDSLKCIMAFLIVLLHTKWAFNYFAEPITRCAVPCFMLISGYMMAGADENRLKKGINKMLKLLLWSFILFALYSNAGYYLKHHELIPFTVEDLFNTIVFNQIPFSGHLWYISSYIYILGIAIFAHKWNIWKWIIAICPLLLVIGLILNAYSIVVFNTDFDLFYSRNFLIRCLPFYVIGLIIKQKEKFLEKFSKKMLLGGVILSLLISYIELWLLGNKILLPLEHDIYFGTYFYAICFFLLFIRIRQDSPNWMSVIGQRDSLYIYILHPIWCIALREVIKYMPSIYMYVAPLVVLLLTIATIKCLRVCRLIK